MLKDNRYFEAKHNEYDKSITLEEYRRHREIANSFYKTVEEMIDKGEDYKNLTNTYVPGLWTKLLKKTCWHEGYKIDFTLLSGYMSSNWGILRVKPKSKVNLIEKLWLDWRYS